MTEVQVNSNGTAKTVTTAAFVSIFTYSFVISLTNVLTNEIVDAFSLTGARQGLMSSMYSLGMMLALVLTPAIQGRVGKLAVIVFSCALQGLMLLAGGFSPVFVLFCASYVILGMGGGLTDAYANSSVVDVRKGESPKYLGFLHGFFGIGSLISPVLVYAMLPKTGWRGVHYILAGVMAASAIAVFLFTRRIDSSDLTAATGERTLSRADIAEYVGNRRNLLLLLAGAFACCSQSALLSWIVRYMTLRFDAAQLGALSISAFWVCATINRFCVARVKVPPMKLLAYGAVLVSVFLAIGVFSAKPIVMCVMAGAAGLSSGHFMPVLFSECAAGYEGKTTFTTSVIMTVMGFVRIITPLLAAFAGSNISVSAGIALSAFAAVVAAGFGMMVVNEDVRAGRNR